MQTLAQILAGVQGDPTQVNPGLSPMIQQAMIQQQLAQPTMAQGGGNMPPMPPGPTPTSAQPNGPGMAIPPTNGFGSMGAAALPMLMGAYT